MVETKGMYMFGCCASYTYQVLGVTIVETVQRGHGYLFPFYLRKVKMPHFSEQSSTRNTPVSRDTGSVNVLHPGHAAFE